MKEEIQLKHYIDYGIVRRNIKYGCELLNISLYQLSKRLQIDYFQLYRFVERNQQTISAMIIVMISQLFHVDVLNMVERYLEDTDFKGGKYF